MTPTLENETAPAATEADSMKTGRTKTKQTVSASPPPRKLDRSALDAAKERVSIFFLWRVLGLPGEPRHNCCSPFRPDKHPSFSISDCERLWKDHATGEGGDAVTFIHRATGCSTADSIARLLEIAGTASTPRPRSATKAKALTFPTLLDPRIIDLADLQHIRGWPLSAGLDIARKLGLLFTASMNDDGTERHAWLITDRARRAAQVRRLDGQPWGWCKAKAWTLGGSDGGWPIGCAAIGERPLVAFCEGGPDLLAAITLAFLHDRHHDVAAVFMAGASAGISAEALAYFKGKRVRIFEHRDAAGERAGPRWAQQLREAGATVDGMRLPEPFKDLSDLLSGTDAEHLAPPLNIFTGMETRE